MKDILKGLLIQLIEDVKLRLKSRMFWVALGGLVYEALQKHGIFIDAGTYQLYIDIALSVLIGGGVYKTFAPKSPAQPVVSESQK